MTSRPLPERLALMVITDPRCGEGRTILDVVRASLAGGAPAIQLRDKVGATRGMFELAVALREETARAGALLIVNDRVDVAIAAGADGAHLGADDLPIRVARSLVPDDFVLGRSVDSPDEALQAAGEGADYLGIGPVFGTPSKTDAAEPIGIAGIAASRRVTRLPIVAIGGLDVLSGRAVAAAGADGIAVIRAVMEAADPGAATRELVEEVRKGVLQRAG